MRKVRAFLRIARITLAMVIGTAVAWRESARLVRKRRELREQQQEARTREAYAVYPKDDPRSTSFAFWMREGFAQHYGPCTDPRQLAARDEAIIGTAHELLEDAQPPLTPEEIERHLHQLRAQLGRITTSAS